MVSNVYWTSQKQSCGTNVSENIPQGIPNIDVYWYGLATVFWLPWTHNYSWSITSHREPLGFRTAICQPIRTSNMFWEQCFWFVDWRSTFVEEFSFLPYLQIHGIATTNAEQRSVDVFFADQLSSEGLKRISPRSLVLLSPFGRIVIHEMEFLYYHLFTTHQD